MAIKQKADNGSQIIGSNSSKNKQKIVTKSPQLNMWVIIPVIAAFLAILTYFGIHPKFD